MSRSKKDILEQHEGGGCCGCRSDGSSRVAHVLFKGPYFHLHPVTPKTILPVSLDFRVPNGTPTSMSTRLGVTGCYFALTFNNNNNNNYSFRSRFKRPPSC